MPTFHGYAAKLYAGAAGSTANTEVEITRDVTVTREITEADDTTRGGGGEGSTAVTIRRWTLEFELKYDPAAAGFSLIRDAAINGTAVALFPRDSANGAGVDGDFVITAWARSETLEGIQTVSVTAKSNTALRNPVWS